MGGGSKPLLDIGLAMIPTVCPDASEEMIKNSRKILENFIQQKTDFQQCKTDLFFLIGSTTPAERINTILLTTPNPTQRSPSSDDDEQARSKGGRKKSIPWTEEEDSRLLAGIHKYGTEDWKSIVQFVGNGRTAAQCSQRWYRILDPRISKERWLEEEDQTLMNLVEKLGKNCWSKIASQIGTRSDVQCRYRYFHLQKKQKAGTNRNAGSFHLEMLAPLPIEDYSFQVSHHAIDDGFAL